MDDILEKANQQNIQLRESEKKLNDQLDELELKKVEEEQNKWINEGVANFANILREDNDNLEKLSVNIITNLVKYLKANQGGIFVINEDLKNPQLELTAVYAYDRIKYAKKTIELGEELVGQCWQEGEQIYLTAVPQNYINITSGLGDSNPRCILLMPLKINEEIYGVIEIASFKKLETYEIQFVEKICNSIASSLSNVKTNVKTAQLLEEAQSMSYQMRAQEEALRQNAEEMLATQEEQDRKIRELEEKLILAGVE